MLCRELGFQVIEVNASDTRNKADGQATVKKGIDGKLANSIKVLTTNTSIGAGADGRPKKVRRPPGTHSSPDCAAPCWVRRLAALRNSILGGEERYGAAGDNEGALFWDRRSRLVHVAEGSKNVIASGGREKLRADARQGTSETFCCSAVLLGRSAKLVYREYR